MKCFQRKNLFSRIFLSLFAIFSQSLPKSNNFPLFCATPSWRTLTRSRPFSPCTYRAVQGPRSWKLVLLTTKIKMSWRDWARSRCSRCVMTSQSSSWRERRSVFPAEFRIHVDVGLQLYNDGDMGRHARVSISKSNTAI